jgi:hypothetical protein
MVDKVSVSRLDPNSSDLSAVISKTCFAIRMRSLEAFNTISGSVELMMFAILE